MCVTFCAWHLPLSIMFQGSPVLHLVWVPHSSSCLSNIRCYQTISHLFYLFVCWCLFELLAIAKRAALNDCIWMSVVISFGCIPREWNCWLVLCLSYLGISKLFHNGCSILHYQQQCLRVPVFPRLSTLVIFCPSFLSLLKNLFSIWPSWRVWSGVS